VREKAPLAPYHGRATAPVTSARSAPMVIYQLQYLRAIAAVSVVLCHASYYVREYRDDPRMWDIFDRAGAFGVVLFFAISGYLMAQLAQSTSGLRFMVHRLIRIYPIYWLCVFVVVSGNRLFGTTVSFDPLALLLVPGGTTSYALGVEWTLPFELTFYAIIFGIIVLRLPRFLPLFGAAWVVAIEAVFALRPDLQQGQFPLLLNLPLSQYSLAFAAGLLVPFANRRRYVGPATLLVALGALAMSEAMPGLALSFGLMCLGCLLLVAVATSPRGTSAHLPNQTLVRLGDWSYALYLCHVPVITALCRTLSPSVPAMQLWFAAVGLPIMVAILVGKIDLAMYRVLKTWVDGSGDLVRGALCGVYLVSIASVGGYTYVQMVRVMIASTESVAIASQIQTAMNANRTTLAAAAESVGLRPNNMLRGFFDGADPRAPGQIYFQGWAADATGGDPALRVLIFQCGHYLGVILTQVSRPDVGAALRLGGERYGFNGGLTGPAGCESADVEGLILSRSGQYSTFSTRVRR
jgi:exopolysaccharide production protein ExoZ